MNNDDIKKKIEEIDAQLEELEQEERNMEQRKDTHAMVDQSEDAINAIRKSVNELIEIDDLESYRKEHLSEYKNKILTIVSYFKYLQREKQDGSEYQEVKNLIMSLGEKYTNLYDWCKDLVENKDEESSNLSLNDVQVNVNESCEYQVNEDLKIVFDLDQVKDYVEKEILTDEMNEKVIDYKVIYKGVTYNYHHYYENYVPKWSHDDECPFIVIVTGATKNSDGDYIVSFNLTNII